MYFRSVHFFSSLSIICCVLLFSNPVNSSGSEKFPLSETLKPNVLFWINVYAKYTEREVIIHDSWDLDIVYEVVNLDKLFPGVKVSSRIEWKKIEQIKKEYQNILRRLSKKSNVKIESLKGKELRIAKLYGKRFNSKRLRAGVRYVRGQTGLKYRFKKGLQRSGIYIKRMREIFINHGMPLELLALPHVESSYNYKAYSKLGAAGLWQFTRSTGRQFMTVNYNVDERLDPLVATESAARLLKKNYETLKSWPLAITAYNHGRGGMKRAKRKFGTDISKIVRRYRSRSFGFASRNFYSEFLAALHVSQNYTEYFGEFELYQPNQFLEFNIPDYIYVKTLLDKLNIKLEEFAEYNPALRNPVLKSKRRIPRNFTIRIPFQNNLDMEEMYAQISTEFKFKDQIAPDWHKVRRGENLSNIARKYRVSLYELMSANSIRNAHRIYVGQNLQIPDTKNRIRTSVAKAKPTKQVETRLAEAVDVKSEKSKSILDVPAIAAERTIEKNTDILTITTPLPDKPQITRVTEEQQEAIAVDAQKLKNSYQSVDVVMAMALPDFYVELTKNNDLRVVRETKVEEVHESFRDVDFPQNGMVNVEPDETLGHFAEWLKVPTYKLRRVNRMSYGVPIQIGQSLLLTFESVTPEQFHTRRVEYHKGIEEDFYRNFRIEGENLYTVRRGDNIWLICNRNVGMPHWLLKKYNPNKNFGKLVAGEDIVIPLVEARFPEDVLNN